MKAKIGLVCSGGDAPGINNAIYGLVEKLSDDYDVIGFVDGFNGIYEENYKMLKKETVESQQIEASSIIGCERFEQFVEKETREKLFAVLNKLMIKDLVIFGGDGSLEAAKIFVNNNFNVHFIPTTIDNDVKEVKQTLGFDTALNAIISFIRRVNYSAKNHKKVQVYELMGRDCSDLTNYIGEAIFADFVINKDNYKNKNLIDNISEEINKSEKRTHIIVISENLLNKEELVSSLQKSINKRIWYSVIGHFQRGGHPSFIDCLYGSKCSERISVNIKKGKKNIIYGYGEDVAIKCE